MKKMLVFLLWLTTAYYSIAQTATNQPLLDLFENMDMNQVLTNIFTKKTPPLSISFVDTEGGYFLEKIKYPF